jgi:carbonic anhydrase
MSNQNINIATENVQGKCDLKCSYSYNYPDCSLTAVNGGVMIGLTCDNSTSPPVTYNNQKYNVTGVTITCPSLHNFNGRQAAAEILITHTPVTGGPLFYVAIPIIASTESSTASNLITQIIQDVATNAPSIRDSTKLNIDGFSLQKIVPNKPFYSYTDNGNDEWIVYGILYAIPLNNSTINTLSQIIKPFALPMQSRPLFYNSSGPNSGIAIGDGIYIKCNPTGSTSEEVAVEYSKNTPSYDLNTLFQSPVTMLIVQVIVGCIIFVIVFATISYLYSFITTGSTKFPSNLIPGQTTSKVF